MKRTNINNIETGCNYTIKSNIYHQPIPDNIDSVKFDKRMNDRHSIMINNQYTDNYIKKLEQRIQMIEQENKTLKISLKEYAGNDFKRQLDYAKLDLAFY